MYEFEDGSVNIRSSQVKSADRVGVGYAVDLARLWLPYRDIGVSYEKLGWVVKDSMVSKVSDLIDGDIADSVTVAID